MKKNAMITVKTKIRAPLDRVWEAWTLPEHIVQWNQASEDWHTPHAQNDLQTGGRVLSRMDAKDGSQGFDFSGQYNELKPLEYIYYLLYYGREVKIHFSEKKNLTEIVESYEPEKTVLHEIQMHVLKTIIQQFKTYAEAIFKRQDIRKDPG